MCGCRNGGFFLGEMYDCIPIYLPFVQWLCQEASRIAQREDSLMARAFERLVDKAVERRIGRWGTGDIAGIISL
jgi:hypothetical protein